MPRAFKVYPKHPAVTFLANLHADLGGRIQDNKKEGKRLAEAMVHVEAVIRMFDPDYDTRRIAVRRRNRVNRWYRRGTMFRAILDVLKGASGPMTAREVTLALLASKGETAPDQKTVRELEGGVRSALSNKEGKTVTNVGLGMPARWIVAPDS